MSERIALKGLRIAALWLLVLAAMPAGAVLEPTTDMIQIEDPTEIPNIIRIDAGRSQIIRTPWNVERVAVADPAVADVQVLAPNEIMLVARESGTTDVMIWSAGGQLWQARVEVEVNLKALGERLRILFPKAGLDVTQSQNVYFVTGTLLDTDEVAQLHGFLEASGLKYVDMTKLAGLQQVQIQVRVAEVNRVAIRELGVNAYGVGEDFWGAGLIGPQSGGALNPISMGAAKATRIGRDLPFEFLQGTNVSPFVTLLAGFPDADLEMFIQALSENQYLRILAEPNLVALSGEEADFLAGGEFPIPIVQGSTAGGGTSITIEYKEFGVRLKFKPTVLGEGRIRLNVAPEVSDLSDVGAVEIEGFRIPSILTRRTETTLELQSGQTFAMAGLLNHSTNSRNSRVPMLGDLPVLGSLFRSVSYQQGESELVVLVTANVVEASDTIGDMPVPGDTHVMPNDWELFLSGRLEGMARGKQGMQAIEVNEPGLSRLKGPGAWSRYGESR